MRGSIGIFVAGLLAAGCDAQVTVQTSGLVTNERPGHDAQPGDPQTGPGGTQTEPGAYDDNLDQKPPIQVDQGSLEQAEQVRVSIDLAKRHQTIDGFGFFGAQSVWWGGGPFVTDEWADLVINDLGLTLWRNELYGHIPVTANNNGMDGWWDKQRPVVLKLKEKADAAGEPLQVVLSVWSPPASMKCQAEVKWAGEGTRSAEPHNSKNEGGTLCVGQEDAYAKWLVSGLKMYADVGVQVAALSLQNELMFREPYSSCVYTSAWYNALLAKVGPQLKAAYPKVRIFGSENMLSMEGGEKDFQYFYHMGLLNDPAALAQLDIWAVHGYSDGVQATAIGMHRGLWWRHFEKFAQPSGKPSWMTETSGYADSWEGSGGKPGAIDLAIAIHAALQHGRASGWIWWQGSDMGGIDEFSLMQGTKRGKKYYASKQFYRYIRPGARMVELAVENEPLVLAAAFDHPERKTFTVVVINLADQDKRISLAGTGLPAKYEVIRTTAELDAKNLGVAAADQILLPPKSVTTLVVGNVLGR